MIPGPKATPAPAIFRSNNSFKCRAVGGLRAGSGRAGARGGLNPLHETIDHLLLAGFLERDRQLVAVDFHNVAVAELLVKHAVVEREFGNGAGGFRDQFALDDHWAALVARKTVAARAAVGRLGFVEAAARLSATAAAAAIFGAVGLRALPARRGVAGAEGFDIVEARRAITAAAAPAGAAF